MSVTVSKGRELLPVGPFQLWLRERLVRYGSVENLAEATGMNPRRLFVFLSGKETVGIRSAALRARGIRTRIREVHHVSIDVVDAALVMEGSTMLVDVYPEAYEFEETV